MRILFALLLLFSYPALAQEKKLHLELADDRVNISTGFNGTQVALFGTTSIDGNVVITLTGPERTVVLRRKGRVMGAWMNNKSVEFRRVPTYYDYAASINDATLEKTGALLDANQIGVNHLGFYPEDDDEKPDVINSFRDALIAEMQSKGFYPVQASNVSFVSAGFFKTVFTLPPGVPTGGYRVEAMVIKDGAVVAKESKELQVGQVGFNARVYLFSDNHSFFYGIFAVLMALFSGWSAFTFLRRD